MDIYSLVTNPYVCFTVAGVGILLGIVGVLVTIYMTRTKKPLFRIRSNNIIHGEKNSVEGLEVRYHGYGQPITNLTVSRILFTNEGRGTIRKTDIIATNPVRLRIRNPFVFLSAEILEFTADINKFEIRLSQDRTEINIKFEFIDPGNYVLLQVFHTGTRSEDIHFVGTIADSVPIERVIEMPDSSKPYQHIMSFIFLISVILMIVIIGVVGQRLGLGVDWSLFYILFIVISVAASVVISYFVAHAYYYVMASKSLRHKLY